MATAPSNTCLQLLEKIVKVERNSDYFGNLNNVVKGIQDGHFKLYECVEHLGPYLTNADVGCRAKGIEMLKDMIERLPKDYLNDQEVGKLVVFFCDRLNDNDSVVSQALQGLLILGGHQNLTGHGVHLILKGIFQDVFTQARPQKDRYCVLLILRTFLQFRLEDLKAMGLDFISGFIQTIDGEKDPRNLSIAFGMIPVVIHNLSPDPFMEDLFELCGRYFPIDYFPPANDSRGVRREELLLGLRSCLSSTPKFAEYCLPMLLEKLDSELESAKLDSLQTLSACVGIYGFEGLLPFYGDIWKSIRREICCGLSKELENASMEALTATYGTLKLDGEEISANDVAREVLDSSIKECVSYLRMPDTKLIAPAAKLLKAIIVSSRRACEEVLCTVMPLLLDGCTPRTEETKRRSFFDVLNAVLEGCARHMVRDGNPLDAHKDSLLKMYADALMEDLPCQLKVTLLQGLQEVSSAEFLFSTVELQTIARHLTKLFMEEHESVILLAYQHVLLRMSEGHSSAMLPVLGEVLAAVDSGDSNLNSSTLKKHLMLVVALLKSDEGLAVVIPSLWNKLKWSVEVREDTVLECVFRCLDDIVKGPVLGSANSPFWYREVLVPSMQLVDQSQPVDDFQLVVLKNVAHLFGDIVPVLEIREASLMLAGVLDVYLGRNRVVADEAVSRANAEATFKLGSASMLLVESVINSVRKEVLVEFSKMQKERVDSFLSDALSVVRELQSDDAVVLAACRSMGSLLNKMPDGEHLDKQISTVVDAVRLQNLQGASVCEAARCRTVFLLLWVTKAVLMRGHRSVNQFIEELFRYLSDEAVSHVTSANFDIILGEFPTALNDRFHANICCLYKQRFFVLTSNRLITAFYNANEGVKYNYMTSLIKMTANLPKEVFMPEIPAMLPVLIEGLLSIDSGFLAALLSLVSELLVGSPSLLEPYYDTLIPHLLDLANFRSAMKVRIYALNCLEKLAKLSTHVVVRHRDEVTRRLIDRLDDPKRLVRQAAVAARSKWFLVGSPGGGS